MFYINTLAKKIAQKAQKYIDKMRHQAFKHRKEV